MKSLGAVMIVLSAVIIIFSYRNFLMRGRLEAESYLAFLKFLHTRMSCCPAPYSELCRDYDDRVLEQTGFLTILREGGSPREAYSFAGSKSVMSKEAQRLLSEYFSSSGKGYLDGEIRSIECCVEQLSAVTDKERAEGERKIKLAASVLIAAALGTVILLL